MGRISIHAISIFAVLVMTAFSQTAQKGAIPQNPSDTKIGPEDTITINALDAEEISKAWRVSVAGDVNLPMLGRVRVAGLTVDQAETKIAELLRKYVKEPHVTIFVSESRSQPVTVTGAVVRPGTIQMDGAKTLLDIIARAGGPHEAGPVVTVTRSILSGAINYPGAHPEQDGKFSAVELRLADVMDGRSTAAALPIKPQDVIYVSESKQPKLVHISGEVNRPGAVELVTQDRISVKKVLAIAGGFTRTAKPSKTMIVHVDESGVQTSSAMVDLKKTMSGQTADIELIPGDIVIVNSSQLMTYVQAASMSAITSGIYILGRF
jgi:polysaccharide export outer membrane protein